jgi:DNA-binding transcriptional LysR family regulator
LNRFQSYAVFVKVVELGSFVRAAERLDLSTSAVSRHVADLEEVLGVRLLNRTTRRLSLTEAGSAFHERVVQILFDVEEAESAITAGATAPRGTLRFTCAIAFGERYIAPAIAEFGTQHPELRFDVELSDRMVDLVEEGLDLAVRIGTSQSQALIARRIGETQLVCCAAPAYLALHGVPRTPADLAKHRCLTYSYLAVRDTWEFEDASGRKQSVRIAGPVNANNGGFLAAIARTGMAIAMEPDFLVGDDLRAGRLVGVLPGYTPRAVPIYAVYPTRRHLSAKVRAFVDFLAGRCANELQWQLPASGAVRRPKRR